MAVTAATAAEITYIRMMAGDQCSVYTDEQIEVLWQRAEGSECETIVYLLRALVADSQSLYDEGSRNSDESRARSVVYKNTLSTLKQWEKRCGMQGGALSVGVMDLGIDQETTS